MVLSLSELNRFTINSIVPNHHTNAGRQALRDDNNAISAYWLRSAGASGVPVANVWTSGNRAAFNADFPNLGIRPSLKKTTLDRMVKKYGVFVCDQ